MNIKQSDIRKDPLYQKISCNVFQGISSLGLDIIINLARIYNVKKFFEFGTWAGLNALEIAKHTEIVYSIDLRVYLSTIERDNLIRIIADSTKFDFSPFKEYFDMVFVDGGHVYSIVKSDTENGLKILKTGGIIAWHDYVPETDILEYDVARYIDKEIKPIYQLYRDTSGIIFAKKE